MKAITINNDNTLGFSMIKYMKELSEQKSMEEFCVWFVEFIIFPYKKEDGVLNWIAEVLGFRKVPTIDKIYWKLKIAIINN